MDEKSLKTVFVTTELIGPHLNGGIGTFVTTFAFLLREQGYPVSIVYLNRNQDVMREEWGHIYDDKGIEVIQVHPETGPVHERIPNRGKYWYVEDSMRVADLIPEDADIIYNQELMAPGFTYHRKRRFKRDQYPVIVTVMHSSTTWIRYAMELYFAKIREAELAFAERLSTEQSDYVVGASNYMTRWAKQNGWKLPPDERVIGFGLPFAPERVQNIPPVEPAEMFKRIIFFGRLETRKGFELLIDTLVRIKKSDKASALDTLEEVIILGRNGVHRFGDEESARLYLESEIEIPVRIITNLDTYQANQLLIDNRADSLVVTPSLIDNFPNAVMEATLIPGLNLLASNTGGIPEIVERKDQLFAPYVDNFAERLCEWLEHGPQPADELSTYDYASSNQRWLNLHKEICDYTIQRHVFNQKQEYQPLPHIDVCIVNNNRPRSLRQALRALSMQGDKQFTVYIVNDASDLPQALAAWEELKEQYKDRDWHFIVNENYLGPGESRNLAAKLGNSEYILFLDADTIPTPETVEGFTQAIRNSGDDCLTSYYREFTGDNFPYEVTRDDKGQYLGYEQTCKTKLQVMPMGNSTEIGLFYNVFGDKSFIIRREAFEEVGGFGTARPTFRYIGGEVYELLTKLSFEGYQLEVIPEILFYQRHWDDGTPEFQNNLRVLDVYREKLRSVGLEHLSPFLHGINETQLKKNV